MVYTENGVLRTKYPIESHDPHLGRIWAKQVTPPHTVASLKRCICGVEGISESACIRGQVFATISGESALSDGPVSILTSGGLGATPDEPISIRLIAKDLTFIHKVLAKCSWSELTTITWLNISNCRFVDATLKCFPQRYISVTEGEILYTDGVDRLDNPKSELKTRRINARQPIC
jgi:hypothetical protein